MEYGATQLVPLYEELRDAILHVEWVADADVRFGKAVCIGELLHVVVESNGTLAFATENSLLAERLYRLLTTEVASADTNPCYTMGEFRDVENGADAVQNYLTYLTRHYLRTEDLDNCALQEQTSQFYRLLKHMIDQQATILKEE